MKHGYVAQAMQQATKQVKSEFSERLIQLEERIKFLEELVQKLLDKKCNCS